MVKKLLVLFLIFNSYFTYAETIKTDVLVIGNGASAVAAAMQCARSKVKTLLIVKGAWLEGMKAQNMIVLNANRNLPSGIWGGFRREVISFYKNTPDMILPITRRYNFRLLQVLLSCKKWPIR